METKTESPPSDQITKTSLPSPPSHSPTDLPSTPAASEDFSSNFAALYHSIFPPKSPPISLSLTPSTVSSYSSESRLRQASLILDFQELSDHYEVSLARLRSLSDELASLRAENAELRIANSELVRLLTLPSRIGPMKSAVDSNRRNNNNDVFDEQRTSLPKSISVRSSGYLKLHRQGNASASSTGDSRPRLASRLNQLVPMQHRVYVPAVEAGCGGGGGDNGGESAAVEFEVYNQGMRKTELCNKWQETGTCPYGDQCQFAHGIYELRPVIRHPRYKTQVCRMVLAGDICPYGHRCHFRHSLTDQERLLFPR